MTISIQNQKPVELYPDPKNTLAIIDPFIDEYQFIDELTKDAHTRYVDPLYQPIIAQTPVRITDTSTNPPLDIDQQTLQAGLMAMWQNPNLDIQLKEQFNEIYRQSMQHQLPNIWYFDEQLLVEALAKESLPLPVHDPQQNRIVRYTANHDVIPAAKTYLSNQDDKTATQWFANIGAYVKPFQAGSHLLVSVLTADAWTTLKSHIQLTVQQLHAQQPIGADVLKMFSDLNNIDLANDITTTLFMPNGGGFNPAETKALSFTRIFMYALSTFEKQTATHGQFIVQPTNIIQTYAPQNIIINNIENYAHARPAQVQKEWDNIEKAMIAKAKINFISNKKLLTADIINRSMNSQTIMQSGGGINKLVRTAIKPLSGKPVSSANILKLMVQVINSQKTNRVTQNTYKAAKTTYMRPNRRQPDNINLPGKITTTHYRPDIHIYLDTSGSISESQYRDAVINLIKLSKKTDCNLYFTSFSHVVSQSTLVQMKNRSIQDIYKQVQLIPKVSGGTEFTNVWNMIEALHANNMKNGRAHRLNFVITDFGYSLPNSTQWTPNQANVNYTYYVPISTESRNWQYLRCNATHFMKQMRHAGDYSIRNRMLF